MVLLLILPLLICLALPAHATIYRYRDSSGRLHITNRLSAIPPAYREQAHRDHRAGAGPVLARSSSVAPSAGAASAAPAPATPVSSAQFARIRDGMSAAEVRQRLGAPQAIEPLPPFQLRTSTVQGGVVISHNKNVERYNWLYPAGEDVPRTVIRFADGEVMLKYRVQ